jgi:hypothetical protein
MAEQTAEPELTAEELAVAVALARTFRNTPCRNILDSTAREMAAALRVANWVHRPAQAAEPAECLCCLGDPDLVCDACGSHDCWAGNFMCEDARTAGVKTRPVS